jgi:hypothetical protein
MNIIEAIHDPKLFRPFLGDNLGSWQGWFTALRVLYGLPVGQDEYKLIQECTHRFPSMMPKDGFDCALFLTGRRSGKSRTAAIIGAYEAVLAGHEKKLAKGEVGCVAICAPTKWQGRVCRDYLRSIFDTPLLENEIEDESSAGFTLTNGNEIQILAGDFRTVRGFTLIAAIVDEVAFFGYDDEGKVRSDTELIRAIRPALATTRGKLVAITSPYATKGWTWHTHKKNHGNDEGNVLVWNCPSRSMNPTLPQSVIDDAMAEDLAAAKSEYFGEFRDDIAEFLPRSIIEALVVKGRQELLPRGDTRYSAFCDLSGGRVDDAALAIAHREDRKVIVDYMQRFRPPFSPHQIVAQMCDEIRRFSVRYVVGDNYAADFVSKSFESYGVRYQKAEKPKSQLYLELLPRLCSGEIELLDNETLVSQLASLERRTRSGGRDAIDHPVGGHDDLANVVAGVAEATGTRIIRIGAIPQF